MSAVDDYREAQVAEWGKYRAAKPIYIGGARAFNEGDPVPASHVDNGVVRDDEVVAVKAKSAAAPAQKRDN